MRVRIMLKWYVCYDGVYACWDGIKIVGVLGCMYVYMDDMYAC